MKSLLVLFVCLVSTQAIAGNVIEMSTRDMSGAELGRTITYTEPNRSRMDQAGEDGEISVIFMDDEFLVLDHAQRNYIAMDEEMLEGVAAQVNDAMKELEAQLADLPPGQREMMEQMMREQMGGLGMTADMPVLEIRKLGSGRWQSYDCALTEMLEDGVKIQEICSVDYDEVDGSGDVRDSFLRMASLLSKLYDAIPFSGKGLRSPMEMLNELEGFPVRAVEFENGQPVRETILESTTEKAIDPGIFSVPPDYSRVDPFAP